MQQARKICLRKSLVERRCLRPTRHKSCHRFLRDRYHSSSSEAVDALTLDTNMTTHVRSSLCPSGRTIDYARGWAWQQLLLSQRLAHRRRRQLLHPDHHTSNASNDEHDTDVILLLEHDPVYTLGRGADEDHLVFLKNDDSSRQRLSRSNRGAGSARLSVDRRIANSVNNEELTTRSSNHKDVIQRLSELACPVLAPNGAPIYRVERGGEVTFHGPSQLVVYPMLDLQQLPYHADLHWFLRKVEQVVIDTLADFNVEGARDDDHTGVWVGDDKIAAVGVSASRWITTHGFALNVAPDLSYFDPSIMVPCGIEERGVTSLAKVLSERGETSPTLIEVSNVVLNKLKDVFSIELQHAESIS
jgi:lipoyl(octanoyl) transferase